jgi:uncharacterized membrane protein (DUF485 family)
VNNKYESLTLEGVEANKPSGRTTFKERFKTWGGKRKLLFCLISLVMLVVYLKTILITPQEDAFSSVLVLVGLLLSTIFFSLSFFSMDFLEKKRQYWIDTYVIPYQESQGRNSTTDIVKFEVFMEYEEWLDDTDVNTDVAVLIDGRLRHLDATLVIDNSYEKPTLTYIYISKDIDPSGEEEFLDVKLHMSKDSLKEGIVFDN